MHHYHLISAIVKLDDIYKTIDLNLKRYWPNLKYKIIKRYLHQTYKRIKMIFRNIQIRP